MSCFVDELMLWFGPGKIAYKCTNQSSKYTNGTFQLKSPNRPDEFFLSIDDSRTVHNVQSSSTLFMYRTHVYFRIIKLQGLCIQSS